MSCRTSGAPRLLTILAVVGGCGGAEVPLPATGAEPRAAARVEIEELEPAAMPAAWEREERCVPGEARDERLRFVDYDYEPLLPLPFGASVESMPVPRLPPSRTAVHLALRSAERLLGTCYRWAAHPRPGLRGELRLALLVDPLGRIHEVTTVESFDGAEELGECVRDVLAGLDVDLPSSAPARADVRLSFVPHPSTTRAARRPARPAAPPPSRGGVPLGRCVAVERSAAPVPLRPVTLLVHDFDADAARQEARRRTGRMPPTTIRSIGAPRLQPDYTQAYVRRMIRSNVGAYRACAIEAVERNPEAMGTVVMRMTLDSRGRFERVLVEEDGVGDAALGACLAEALDRVRFASLVGHRLELSLPFALGRAEVHPLAAGTLEEIDANAHALLAEQQHEPALARFDALIEAAPAHDAACTWHLGALAAAGGVEPWGHGPRSTRAAERLIASLGRGSPSDCVAQATRALRHHASRYALPSLDELEHESWGVLATDLYVDLAGWLSDIRPALALSEDERANLSSARAWLRLIEAPELVAEPSRSQLEPCVAPNGNTYQVGETWEEACARCACGVGGGQCLRLDCPAAPVSPPMAGGG